MEMDLIIRGGTVIDPATGTKGTYDVLVRDGRIAEVVAAGSYSGQVKQEIDAAGCIVTPGLIDLHVHVFEGVDDFGANPDVVGVQQGVTTVVDAGSSGASNFKEFMDMAADSKTEVVGWINVSGPGLAEGLSELADLKLLNVTSTLDTIREYSDKICGVKARMSGSVIKESGLEPLKIAKSVAKEANLPVMIHIGNAPPKLPEVLDLLEKGDVVTHAFHGKKGGILTEEGTDLIPEARAALARGVLFDIGHGTASFSFKTMRRAKALGVDPYSVSTDIYTRNFNGPVHSLVMTMTKMLAVGYSIEQAIEWSTVAPAKVLRRADDLGTLQVGTIADISILQVVNEDVVLTDSDHEQVVYNQIIKARYSVKSGEVITCAP
ncbi:amidohydrolase/deacetylase family metallohydrolase [Paenibacillus sp. N1-5-1-14]|uniref:amidohydrolase/deacetylase family metallohydrolase n=1 Tax=Paenibacillus radicibacter TaxID=2972488 RepID=UPI0021597163|nr:amidohydrolase/deacetylase family metallohydrolase [Paenibacillus radicibacter]MCR8644848.1 amidohydrolase/deacetylase family metallohydrolase [Paenibacillus radicibacter]